MDYDGRRHAIMVHYKRSLERLLELEAAIQRIREEKRLLYVHLSHPPASALALFNAEDLFTMHATIAGMVYGDRDAFNLGEVNEMIEREEYRLAHKVQDARIGFRIDQGPFLPSYLPR